MNLDEVLDLGPGLLGLLGREVLGLDLGQVDLALVLEVGVFLAAVQAVLVQKDE